MPIAAPLLIPFAEAIGIAIAGRGLMEISEQVQKFIQNKGKDKSFQITAMVNCMGTQLFLITTNHI